MGQYYYRSAIHLCLVFLAALTALYLPLRSLAVLLDTVLLSQIFTQSIDAIDVTSVTLSCLNSINAIDVTRC